MKKIVLFFACVLTAVWAQADGYKVSTLMQVWQDGAVQAEYETETVDSLTFLTVEVLPVFCEDTVVDMSNLQYPVPASFARRWLVEQFTSQSCGYCPLGAECLQEVTADDDRFVWISHHAGYNDDAFTVKESKSVASAFSVTSAPMMMLNRVSLKNPESKARVFHPCYIEEVLKLNEIEEEAGASIFQNNEYNAETRELTVRVYGQLAEDVDASKLRVSVLLKESGLHNWQSDYINTWEGWEEFVHAHVVRKYLTAYSGAKLTTTGDFYYLTYTVTLDESFTAENMSVVAFVHNNTTKQVLNVSQVPVVEGTAGGEDIVAGGVTAVAVGELYPETEVINKTYTLNKSIVQTLDDGSILAYYYSLSSETIDRYASSPFFVIQYRPKTEGATAIEAGTYKIKDEAGAGEVLAGARDNEHFEFVGSQFLYVYTPYLKNNQLATIRTYLLRDGEVTVGEDGTVTIKATTLNGSEVVGTVEK